MPFTLPDRDVFIIDANTAALATYEAADDKWHIRAGEYDFLIGESAAAPTQSVKLMLPDTTWSAATAGQ